MDGLKTILSFWVPAYFQGELLVLRSVNQILSGGDHVMSQKICLPGEYRIPALNVEFDLLHCHGKTGHQGQV